MTRLDPYEREIRSLHAFFVDWYAGTLEPAAFDRLERALAPTFEMIHPSGERYDREAVLEQTGEGYGRDGSTSFEIEIRNVDLVAGLEEHALVRYEEWQTHEMETTGRISTVLFRAYRHDREHDRDRAHDQPLEHDHAHEADLEWLTLQETWLESPTDR